MLTTLPMMRLDQDVRPLTEVRARVADFIRQVTVTGRPLLITQRGRGMAVLIGVHEFSALQERLEFLEGLLAKQQYGLPSDGPPTGTTIGPPARLSAGFPR